LAGGVPLSGVRTRQGVDLEEGDSEVRPVRTQDNRDCGDYLRGNEKVVGFVVSGDLAWVTSQKNGASALGVKRILGWGSYETAWTWLHKLRRAMVRPGQDRLSGTIQAVTVEPVGYRDIVLAARGKRSKHNI